MKRASDLNWNFPQLWDAVGPRLTSIGSFSSAAAAADSLPSTEKKKGQKKYKGMKKKTI